MTGTQLIRAVAAETGFKKAHVKEVFDALAVVVERELQSRPPQGKKQTVDVPGVVKLRVVERKATQDRTQYNPLAGRDITIKGKPAGKQLKATIARKLRDLFA